MDKIFRFVKINYVKIIAALAVLALISIILNTTWAGCVFYGIIAAYLMIQHDEKTIIGFMFMILFQNIILIIFSGNISSIQNMVFSLTKELMIYGAAIIGAGCYIKECGFKTFIIKYKWIILFLFSFFFIVIKNIFFTDAGNFAVIVSVRQLLVPFMCLFCGFFLDIDKVSINKIWKYIVGLALILTIIGIIEMFLPHNLLWKVVDYCRYLQNKQNGVINLYDGVTANFYTWDLGFLMRRLVSITADPLATSHLIFIGFAVICTKYLFNSKNKWNILISSVLVIGCILGFSKGIFIYFGILICFVIYDKFGYKWSKKINILILACIILGLIGTVVMLYVMADGPTASSNHINGLLDGIKVATLWGNGMGTAGAVTGAIAGASVKNTESYYGVCLNQIGWYGAIIGLGLWIHLLRLGLKNYLVKRDKNQLLMVILIVGLTIDMLLSESSASIMGTGIYFIIIGILYRMQKQTVETIKEKK